MSRIALVSAMHEELAAVLARMPDEQKTVVAGREFWLGHWHGHEVVAVLSRIGKVAAATTTTVLIERFGVSRVVFTGVAGGLAPQVDVGDVVSLSAAMQNMSGSWESYCPHAIRQDFLQRFSRRRVVDQLLEIYQRVLKKA